MTLVPAKITTHKSRSVTIPVLPNNTLAIVAMYIQ